MGRFIEFPVRYLREKAVHPLTNSVMGQSHPRSPMLSCFSDPVTGSTIRLVAMANCAKVDGTNDARRTSIPQACPGWNNNYSLTKDNTDPHPPAATINAAVAFKAQTLRKLSSLAGNHPHPPKLDMRAALPSR
mmetsp:Transcript_131/g.998  ORF Transcript_131/g.998 Transcript_131/m.998 type:complete len:133 (+) Transcript_131:2292-2690(+)